MCTRFLVLSVSLYYVRLDENTCHTVIYGWAFFDNSDGVERWSWTGWIEWDRIENYGWKKNIDNLVIGGAMAQNWRQPEQECKPTKQNRITERKNKQQNKTKEHARWIAKQPPSQPISIMRLGANGGWRRRRVRSYLFIFIAHVFICRIININN